MGKKPKSNVRWSIIGLVALALVTAGVVAFALSPGRVPAAGAGATFTAEPLPTVTTAAPKPVVAFLGDSYTVGARATGPAARWSTIVAGKLGWAEQNFGISDTGYFDAGKEANGAPYHARVSQVAAVKPEIVIVSGGRNDLYRGSQADIDAAIHKTFHDLRAELPAAKIVAVNPFWGADAVPQQLEAVAATVKASSAEVGGTYQDIGQPLQGHPEWMHADQVHPVDAGYSAIAQAFIATYKP